MKRWFFTTLITDPESGERYPRVSPYSHPSSPVLKNYSSDDPEDDKCCGLVALPNLSTVSQDPAVFILDDVPLGVSWGSIPQARRDVIAAAIRSFGFTFAAHGTWPMKQVIEHVVHQVQPGVNIEFVDIIDPWG